MNTPSTPRHLGTHHGKHSKGRGEPWRLPVVIPALLLAGAILVGLVIYAISGGFSGHKTTGADRRPPASTTLPTFPASPGSTSSTSGPSTAGLTSPTTESTTSTTTPSTTTSSTTSTTSTTTTTEPPAPTVPASQVLVEVENGNGQPLAGKTVGTALTNAGFVVNGVGDASSFSYGPSEILYSAGSEIDATTLEDVVEGTVTTKETPGLPSGEVYFIVGADYEGIRG